jgi:hypothetical protein
MTKAIDAASRMISREGKGGGGSLLPEGTPVRAALQAPASLPPPTTVDATQWAAVVSKFIKTGKSAVFGCAAAALATARHSTFDAAVEIVGKPNFQKIGTKHLTKIYELLDRVYFKGCLSTILKNEHRVLSFRLSSRMTQRAGQVMIDKDRPLHHELAISSFLLLEAFSKENTVCSRAIMVNGLKCENRLQCLLRIMEHELIHLLFCCSSIIRSLGLMDSSGNYVDGYHGRTFQLAVRLFFGHTDWQHSLVTRDELAFIDRGIEVGALISFLHEGKQIRGKVNRVQKRVTVLVQEDKNVVRSNPNAMLFSDGNKYIKYYVPIDECSKVG